MFNRQIIMTSKLKMYIQYIIDTTSLESIPIRPSLASSSSMGSSSDSLNPKHRLRSLFFIFPCVDSSHRILSRRLCEGSIISRTTLELNSTKLAMKRMGCGQESSGRDGEHIYRYGRLDRMVDKLANTFHVSALCSSHRLLFLLFRRDPYVWARLSA
jgi:hypothetical protein